MRQLVDLVARILAYVPPWVRIYRIQRDIPMPLVTSGVEKGNLRELALARMGHLGLRCRDVRTRECGIQDIHHKASWLAWARGTKRTRRHFDPPAPARQVRPEEVELIRRDYTANGGWETFLEYGDPRQDILVGLLRLRRLAGLDAERQPELRGRCSIVRELHVYGTAVAVHARDASKFQPPATERGACSVASDDASRSSAAGCWWDTSARRGRHAIALAAASQCSCWRRRRAGTDAGGGELGQLVGRQGTPAQPARACRLRRPPRWW